jgi:hypothetical protein
METKQDPSSSGALELLQILALTFRDMVDKLLAILEKDDQDQPLAEDSLMTEDVQGSVTVLLAEIANSERLRSTMYAPPNWCGPIEQLSLQVAGDGELLLDHADELLAEVEAHNIHTFGCRCYQLLDLLHDRIDPALTECRDLLHAIAQLRQHRRSPS